MPSYSFELTRESVTYVINNLSGQTRNLNDYENKFVADMKQHYIVENKWMSEGQYEFLSKLWEKY